MRKTLRRLSIQFATALLCASAAHAVDGVTEINDASITAAGGYPALISASGSYVLTGNLTPPAGTNAIDVIVSDVTIDLNGFQVSTPAPIATGINGASAGLTVRNGSVTGFATGIIAGVSGKVIQVHVTTNSSAGIVSGGGCLILQSTIAGNGTGISANRCKIENNVVEGNGTGIAGASNLIVHNNVLSNGGGGILTFSGSVIQQNVIEDNGAFGIGDGMLGPVIPPPPGPPRRNEIIGNTVQGTFFGPGISVTLPAVITDNTVSANATDGIFCGASCSVRGNVVESNNFTAAVASGGITVFDGSNVTDNSISYNMNFGLTLPITAGYSQNTFNMNGGGLVDVASPPHPTAAFMNLCSGVPGPALTCP